MQEKVVASSSKIWSQQILLYSHNPTWATEWAHEQEQEYLFFLSREASCPAVCRELSKLL